MRTLCFVLLVASIFIASEASLNSKVNRKRLLLDGLLGGVTDGLLGGLTDGLLTGLTGNLLVDLGNTLNTLLTQTTNVLNSLLGGNGVVGGLLNQVLGIDIVDGIVGDINLDVVFKAVDNLVTAAVQTVAKVVKDLLDALQGVDPSDNK